MCISSIGKKLDCCQKWPYQERAQVTSVVTFFCCIAIAIISGRERAYSCQQMKCDTEVQRIQIIDKRETMNNWACGLAVVGAVFACISFVYLSNVYFSKCCGQSGSSSGDGSAPSSLSGRVVSSDEDNSSAGSVSV